MTEKNTLLITRDLLAWLQYKLKLLVANAAHISLHIYGAVSAHCISV